METCLDMFSGTWLFNFSITPSWRIQHTSFSSSRSAFASGMKGIGEDHRYQLDLISMTSLAKRPIKTHQASTTAPSRNITADFNYIDQPKLLDTNNSFCKVRTRVRKWSNQISWFLEWACTFFPIMLIPIFPTGDRVVKWHAVIHLVWWPHFLFPIFLRPCWVAIETKLIRCHL